MNQFETRPATDHRDADARPVDEMISDAAARRVFAGMGVVALLAEVGRGPSPPDGRPAATAWNRSATPTAAFTRT
jgi:hypothetical protein